ncbi:MAG: hypothetical protein Kow0069_11400 [Promethearchaeota archaeon]
MAGQPVGSEARLRTATYLYHAINDGVGFLVPTAMGRMVDQFGLTFFQVNAAFATNVLATLLLQVACGYWVDAGRGRSALLFGPVLLAGTTLFLPLAQNFRSLLLLNALSGVALGIQHPTTYAVTARLSPAGERGRRMGVQAASGDAGKLTAIASTSAALLSGGTWQVAFLAWGVASAAAAGAVIVLARDSASLPVWLDQRQARMANYKEPAPPRPRRHLLPMFAAYGSFVAYNAAFDLDVKNFTAYARVARPGRLGPVAEAVYVAMVSAGALGAFLSGRVTSRFGQRSALVIEFLCCAACLLAFLLAGDLLWASAAAACGFTFFQFLAYPAILSAASEVASPGRHGSTFGLILSVGWLGGAIAGPLGGLLADAAGPDAIYWLSVAAVLVALVLSTLPGDSLVEPE